MLIPQHSDPAGVQGQSSVWQRGRGVSKSCLKSWKRSRAYYVQTTVLSVYDLRCAPIHTGSFRSEIRGGSVSSGHTVAHCFMSKEIIHLHLPPPSVADVWKARFKRLLLAEWQEVCWPAALTISVGQCKWVITPSRNSNDLQACTVNTLYTPCSAFLPVCFTLTQTLLEWCMAVGFLTRLRSSHSLCSVIGEGTGHAAIFSGIPSLSTDQREEASMTSMRQTESVRDRLTERERDKGRETKTKWARENNRKNVNDEEIERQNERER